MYKGELDQYRKRGLCFLRSVYAEQELSGLKNELNRLSMCHSPGAVYEKDGRTVRALHGCHLVSRVFEKFTRSAVLISIAKEILKGDVYVHQLKVNYKNSFTGAKWDWHQDFIFWNKEDGIPKPELLNVMIPLDEINEFNGPLFLIPESHHEGMIDNSTGLKVQAPIETDDAWKEGFSESLKYTIQEEKVRSLVDKHGLVMGKCQAGDIMLFDSNIVHASSSNISPYKRRVLIITYNKVGNYSLSKKRTRPDFICSRNYQALSPEN